MNQFPSAEQRLAAGVQLIELAEALGSPRISFEEALSTARTARPDLAATVDFGFATPASKVSARPARRPTPVPRSAHEQLLVLAEHLRAADRTLTAETAYAQAMTDNPAVLKQLAAEQGDATTQLQLAEKDRAARIAFGEHLGPQLQRFRPDSAYAAQPAAWASRAQALYQAGRAPTVEQGYLMAMEGR